MGRGAATIGTQDASARILDGPACGIFFEEEEGASAPDGVDPPRAVLSGAPSIQQGTVGETENAESQVIPAELWLNLSLTERARFGQCFSCLVLKASGLRSMRNKEVTHGSSYKPSEDSSGTSTTTCDRVCAPVQYAPSPHQP